MPGLCGLKIQHWVQHRLHLRRAYDLIQELTNYSPQAKSGLQPVWVNKDLLELSQAHSSVLSTAAFVQLHRVE